ncbi:major facilitator superfamily domain-containing protein [Gigaspora rosea]|uniref:Major facilitator superfamily domain-containing protein n=1 Tax=Gigaspora rosea TaxID=44941 RepID=A0A397UXY7_9GLOM|nr:major facilitator superfamily domain-containing protein [Gigaspora rosea]
MSIAIIYMAKEFNWSHNTQGLVSSSFYFGYITTQIIGGALTDKFGGKRILGIAFATRTLFTLLTPISARINIYCLILCRICLGIGEGPVYPCFLSLTSKWFPPEERTRAVTAVNVSNLIGMAIAMPISNLLGSSQFGWESIFLVFAVIGFIWSIIWHFYGESDPRDYSEISKEELDWILKSKSTICSDDNFDHYQSGFREYSTIDDEENNMLLQKDQISSRPLYIRKIPWNFILSRREVWAIMLGHFFNSWGYFILLNWLPIFYYEYFDTDINRVGYYTSLPYISYGIVGYMGGCICDYAIHQLKFHVLTVRRTANIIGTLGITISILFVSTNEIANFFASVIVMITYLAKTSFEASLIMTIGYALYSFIISSLYVSQMDIAPKYAGSIFALGNTCAMIQAFFGVALTGWILEVTNNNWNVIWCLCSLFYILETTIFFSWAGGEVIID